MHTSEPLPALQGASPAGPAAAGERVYALARDEGRHFWFLGSLMTVKADTARTEGGMSLIEQVTPVGFASPLHLHHGEDEPMYILEGRYTFWVGDQIMPAEAGTFVYLPRGVPHCFRLEGPTPGRLLQFTLPGGLEEAFEQMGFPASGPQLPPPPPEPPDAADLDRLLEISARYHVEMLGPPPGQPGFPLAEPPTRRSERQPDGARP